MRVGDTYYADGGLRLNTPMAPALRLGADKVLVIALRQEPTQAGEAALSDAEAIIIRNRTRVDRTLLDAAPLASPSARGPDEVALLLLTSGSTGAPKAVEQSARTLGHFAAAYGQALGLSSEDVFLNWLGLDHVAPLLMVQQESDFPRDLHRDERLIDSMTSPFMSEELLARVDAIVRARHIVLRGSGLAGTWSPSPMRPPGDDLVSRLERVYAPDPLLSEMLAKARAAQSVARNVGAFTDADPFVDAARATSKIKMGPVAVSPYELHPLKMANLLFSLNELSDGRAMIMVGGGGAGAGQIWPTKVSRSGRKAAGSASTTSTRRSGELIAPPSPTGRARAGPG